jgi:hypothetical protein
LLLFLSVKSMENCYYLYHNDLESINRLECKRVYIGHETCEIMIPSFTDMKPILMQMKERDIKLTLLLPFLSEKGLLNAKKLVDNLGNEMTELEVATSDWGLLHWLSQNRIAVPVAGRLLVRQWTDPRLSNITLNEDLKLHVSSGSLFKKEVIDFFHHLGIFRFEVSNTSFELQLPDNENSKFSLHIPYVPVAVMRWCLGSDLNFNTTENICLNSFCKGTFQRWETGMDGTSFFRIDNALYYKQDCEPDNIDHPSMDRIVINRKCLNHD